MLLLPACGAGGDGTGDSANPGGGEGEGGGGGGNPGNGGGGTPGGNGNPLAVVLDFTVENLASTARTETIQASVPFPETGYQVGDLENMVVNGHQTSWRVLQQWADGSVKVAQAQFTDELAAGETKYYVVARDVPAETGTFEQNSWVSQFGSLQIGAAVRDTFQVEYRSFVTGSGEVLHTSPMVECRRYRTYHEAVSAPGIGRDYLTSTYYVTRYRDMPFVVVDWVLGNDYLGADNPPPANTNPNLVALGDADVKSAHFLCAGATECMPYRKSKENISNPVAMSGGLNGFKVMQDDYMSDAQTRRYRFLLRFEPAAASQADKERWEASADAIVDHPVYALATHDAWSQTGAAGLLGGPIAGPANASQQAHGEYGSWNGQNWFGTWGRRGDALVTATTGTPRNHPLSPELAHAIQGDCHELLIALEQKAWAQAMRPYHLWNLQVGAEQQIMLWDGTPMLLVPGEHLGRKRLRDNDPYPQYRTLSTGQPNAHGWLHFDHEHWSTDLLFDYWTISGDAWAKEELRQLGESLKGLMRLTYYYTANLQAARAEGWCMQGFAQIYQATRDESLKEYAMRRVNEIIEPQRMKNHASKAMVFQPNYAGTFYPMNHEFFMPWQHGAVLYGFLGAYEAFQEPILLEICEDVVHTVEYAWVTNMNHPIFGFVANGLRYYVPVTHNSVPIPANYWDNLANGARFGDSPLGGAHTFLIGGLFMLADLTSDTGVRDKALQYGSILRGNSIGGQSWSKWWYCLPQHWVP